MHVVHRGITQVGHDPHALLEFDEDHDPRRSIGLGRMMRQDPTVDDAAAPGDLIAGSSSQVLPTLDPGPLDIVMVDGCHGFPFPQLDWSYAAAHLVDGGILVVDDTQLAAPYELRRYLEHDPRWERVHVGSQWVAFKRLGSGSLDEEWTEQRFHQPVALRVQDARRKARGTLGRLKRSLRG